MDGAAKDADGIQKKGSLEALSKEDLIEKCKSLLVIARRAKQAKDEAGEEVKKLKEQMNVLKAQNEEIKRGGKDCESNKKEREDQLQNELGAMQEMLGTLTEQKLQFTMEIDKLKKQNALLEKQLNQSKVEEVHIRSKVEELETAAESYKRQNHRLTNENEALIQQMETLEISMKEKDVQTAEKNSDKIAALEAELQLARDEVERLTEEDSRKKEQMKQLYATFNKDKTDLEKKLEVETKKQDLEKQNLIMELHVVSEEKEKVLAGIKSIEENNLELHRLVRSIEAERDSVVLHSRRLNEEKHVLETQVELMGESKKIVMDENMCLKCENQHFRQLLDNSNMEINMMRSENNLLKIEEEDFNEQLHSVVHECEKLKHEIKHAKFQLQKILQQIKDFKYAAKISTCEKTEILDEDLSCESSSSLSNIISLLDKSLSQFSSLEIVNRNIKNDMSCNCICRQFQEPQSNGLDPVTLFNEARNNCDIISQGKDYLQRLYSELSLLNVAVSNLEAQGEFLQNENFKLKDSLNYLVKLKTEGFLTLQGNEHTLEALLKSKGLSLEEYTTAHENECKIHLAKGNGNSNDDTLSCHGCKEAIIQLREELCECQNNLVMKTSEVNELQKKLADLEQFIPSSDIEAELRNELNLCRQTLSKKSTELSLLQEELSFLLGKQGSCFDKRRKVNVEVMQSNKCSDEKISDLENIKQELFILREQKHSSQLEVEQLKNEISQVNKLFDSTSPAAKSLTDEPVNLEMNVKKLQHELETSKKNEECLKSSVIKLQEKENVLEKEVIDLKQELEMKCSMLEENAVEKKKITDEVNNEINEDLGSSNGEIHRTKEHCCNNSKVSDTHNSEVEILKETIVQYEREKIQLLKENTDVNNLLLDLKNRTDQNMKYTEEKINDTEVLKKEIAKLDDQRVKLCNELEEKSKILEEKEAMFESIRKSLEDNSNNFKFATDELQEKILKLENEVQNYKFLFDEKCTEFETVKEELEHVRTDAVRISEEFKNQSADLNTVEEEKDKEIEALKVTLLKAESNLAQTLIKFSENEGELLNTQNLLDSLKTQLSEANKLLEEKTLELSTLKFSFEEKCSELCDIKHISEDTASKYEILKTELHRSQASNKENENELQEQLEETKRNYNDKLKECETLRMELDQYQSNKFQFESNLTEIQRQYDEKSNELESITQELQNLKFNLLDSLKTQLSEANKLLEEKTLELSTLKFSFEEKCSELCDIKHISEDTASKYEILKTELQRSQTYNKENENELQKQLEETKRNFNDKLKECETLRMELDQYQSNKFQFESNLTEIQRQYDEKSNELESVTQELQNLKFNFNNTEDELRTAKSNCEDLLKQLECVKYELHTTCADRARIEDDFKIAKKFQEEKVKDIENLKSELDSVRDAHSISTRKLAEMTDQFKENTAKLCKKEEELQHKQKELEESRQANNILNLKTQHLRTEIVSLSSKISQLNELRLRLSEEVKTFQNNFSETLQKNTWIEIHKALTSYIESEIAVTKRESAELLGEMNEMNQVLKQRGETISKLKELNSELEHKLRETNSKLESVQDELKKNILQLETKDKAICNLENELATISEAQQKNMLIKNETIHSLEKEVMKFKECQHELETKTSALEAKEETIHNLEAKLIKQTERLHELSSKEQLIHSLKEELLTLKAVNKGKIKLDEANMSEDNSAKIKELEEEISVLKGRIQQLEHEAEEMRRESGDVHSEVMSSSTISKAEESARLKDLEETFEERYTKLRTVAVRLKKRVSELTVQQTQLENDKKKLASDKADLQAKVTQLSAHAKNLQTMQQEYDRLQDDLETQKSEVKELTKALEVSVNDCASLKVELQECQNEKESKIKELEICLKDKQKIDVANKELASHINSLKKEKEAENATRKEKEKEFKKLEEDLKASEKRLADEIDSHKNTQDLLEASRQECKKRSVLSLEMEDYEKSVADLTQQLAAEKSKAKELDNHLETQRDISRGLQEQILLLEQRIQSEEARTKEVKEQLNSTRTRLTEAEALALEREMSIAELASQIEQERDKNENFVLQLSELAAEKQRLVESARNQQDGLTRQVHALEEHVSHLKENLAEREAELADLRAEFGSYKVRAQSVLRQKARPDDGSSGFNREDYMEELAQLRQMSEVLRSKLQDASSKLQTLTVENNAVQEDRTRVLQRCQELVDTVQDLRNQNSQLQTQLQETAIEHREALRSQKLQAETLNQCYKQQLEELEDRLQKETAALKKQLKETEERLHGARQQTSFVGEVSQSTEANVSVTTPTKQVTTAGPHWNNSTAGFFPVRSTSQQDPENKLEITLLEREEGEGSESVDSTSPHMTTSQEQRTELIPLDKLLSSPSEEDNNVPTVGASPSAELGRTKEQLVLSECRIKHLTGLLTEAERDLAKLTQQNQVLKEEIRRQQRSVEREQHAQNFEYLKNVVLKFVTLQGGDERSRLVPVLNTILKLSPEETNQLNIVAKGGPDNQAGGRGWGSYLHLWPGTQ